MKEIVQFKESDREMIEAFYNLKKEAKRVFDMWDGRFNEIATAWREHRAQIIEELGGSDSEEFDLTDMFYSNLWSMRNGLQSPCNILSSDDSNYDYFLKYIKPIDKLREQEAERKEEIREKNKNKII
jgi:hypothetical protein